MALHETAIDTLVGAEVTDDHGRSREIMLEGRLAPATGGVQWVPWIGAHGAMAGCVGGGQGKNTGQGKAGEAKQSKQQALKYAPGSRADPGTTRLVAGWYPPMLADTHRAALYEQAIKRAIADFKHDHGRAPVVLDIGAGCGLLSMLAIRHGAKHAFAVEQFQGLATVAATVIESNGFAGNITMLAKPSFDVTTGDLQPHTHQGRCDLVLSELLDFNLFGEMAVPILRDAYARLAHPYARSIPASARLYGRVISSPALDALRPHGWPVSSHCLPCHIHGLEPCAFVSDPQLLATVAFDPRAQEGTDGEELAQKGGGKRVQGASLARGTTAGARATAARVSFAGQDGALGGEAAFDLWQGKESRADGLLVWWELDLLSCKGADLTYSSAPATSSGQPYQDHWTQGIFVLPTTSSIKSSERSNSKSSKLDISNEDGNGGPTRGVVVRLGLDDDLTTLRMRSSSLTATEAAPSDACRALGPMVHEHGTLERGAVYGSGVYGRLLVRAMCRSEAAKRVRKGCQAEPAATQHTGLENGGIVLDISEGGVCGLLYARHIAAGSLVEPRGVVIYDTKQHALVCPQVSQPTAVLSPPLPFVNGTTAESSTGTNSSSTASSGVMAKGDVPSPGGSDTGEVRVCVWRGAEYGEGWDPTWGMVQHLVGDTFAHQLRTRPILAALNMVYLRTVLSPVLAPDAAFTPNRMLIRAALVSLPDLAPCHAPLPPVCGLDHTPLEWAMRPSCGGHLGTPAEAQASGGGGCHNVDDSNNGISVLSPIPLWQYRRALVSAPVTLAELSMEEPLEDFNANTHFTATLSPASSSTVKSGDGDSSDGSGADAVVLWVDLETGKQQGQDGDDGVDGVDAPQPPPVVVPGYPFTRGDVQRFRAAMGTGVAEAAEEALAGQGSEGGSVFWTRQLVYWLHGSAATTRQFRIDLTLCHAQGTYTFASSPVA